MKDIRSDLNGPSLLRQGGKRKKEDAVGKHRDTAKKASDVSSPCDKHVINLDVGEAGAGGENFKAHGKK